MNNIIWKRPDGGLSVTHVAAGVDPHKHELVLKTRGDIPADYVCVGHKVHVPDDRTFRDAWTLAGGAVTVDVPKARELTKVRLRRERVRLFAANDLALRDATLAGDASAIAAAMDERDRLRDVTTLADGVTDLEALKALKALR